MNEYKSNYNDEFAALTFQTRLTKDQEKNLGDKYIDIRLLNDFPVGSIYTVEDLEGKFGISLKDGLMVLLNKVSKWTYKGANEFRFMGMLADLDAQAKERRISEAQEKARKVEESSRFLDSIRARLREGQTYSVENLVQIFQRRADEGLYILLRKAADVTKLDNGNYRINSIYKNTVSKQEFGKGYNPLAEQVIKILYHKYGSEKFKLQLSDLPEDLRRKMVPGLLPEIYKYMIDSDILIPIENSKGYYVFSEDFKNLNR